MEPTSRRENCSSNATTTRRSRGPRVESGDDWHHTFRTAHEWRPIPGHRNVAAFDSNTRPTDDDPKFTLGSGRERGTVSWALSLAEPERGPMTCGFAISVDAMSPKPGDRVAEVSFTAEYAEDCPFGSEHETGSALQLEYGDGAADEWAFDSSEGLAGTFETARRTEQKRNGSVARTGYSTVTLFARFRGLSIGRSSRSAA